MQCGEPGSYMGGPSMLCGELLRGRGLVVELVVAG
jgi:hypothetical protein